MGGNKVFVKNIIIENLSTVNKNNETNNYIKFKNNNNNNKIIISNKINNSNVLLNKLNTNNIINIDNKLTNNNSNNNNFNCDENAIYINNKNNNNNKSSNNFNNNSSNFNNLTNNLQNIFKKDNVNFINNHIKNNHKLNSTLICNSTNSITTNQSSVQLPYIIDLSSFNSNKFKILHLNINGLSSKLEHLFNIINLKSFDLISLNETKIDNNTQINLNNNFYNIIRRDRSIYGGGILLLIKKSYKIILEKISDKYELILLHLLINNELNYFLCGYNPHINHSKNFFEYMEFEFLINLNFLQNIFILGDFNNDLLSGNTTELKQFIAKYDLLYSDSGPTRICTKYYKKTDSYKTSSTQIDVIISNKPNFIQSKSISCSFTDHNILISELNITQHKNQTNIIYNRLLNQNNLRKINQKILFVNLDSNILNIDNYWSYSKNIIKNIINEIAPINKLKVKNKKLIQPWFSLELKKLLKEKEITHRIAKLSNNIDDWNHFKTIRKNFKIAKNEALINYFSNCNTKDFKNSKKFWKFYSSIIKIKSQNTADTIPSIINYDYKFANDSLSIANLFNHYFSSIQKSNIIPNEENFNYINNRFQNIFANKILVKPTIQFVFKNISHNEVYLALNKIDSNSSSGYCDISIKVIKSNLNFFVPFLTKIFNYCIDYGVFPEDWKYALVTPLYKNKGSKQDCKNYRPISVISPIVKVFEFLLSNQIKDYFFNNKLIVNCQHGFRKNFSCETALHEIINDLNKFRYSRFNTVILFIDFCKAFDSVMPSILLHKLKLYGFSNSAIQLITSYFQNRKQIVKFNSVLSDINEINVGVPQGSILGPLFFLIFINDMPLFLDLFIKLFADDTTLYKNFIYSSSNIIINKFLLDLIPFLDWCKFNYLNVNWEKTHFMFITNSNVSFPSSINLLYNSTSFNISVVTHFKLLGITLDNKLNFVKHVTNTIKLINCKLFSIKKLFYLSTKVKIQFFKTFLLPYFDYCASLSIYFCSSTIQLLHNSYYFCLYKLFNFKFINRDVTEINEFLFNFNLITFEYRIFTRLSFFIHKIINYPDSPSELKNLLIKRNISYNLREMRPYYAHQIYNHLGEYSFNFFFSNFINIVFNEDISSYNFIIFKHLLFENLNFYFKKFYSSFTKFNSKFKMY